MLKLLAQCLLGNPTRVCRHSNYLTLLGGGTLLRRRGGDWMNILYENECTRNLFSAVIYLNKCSLTKREFIDSILSQDFQFLLYLLIYIYYFAWVNVRFYSNRLSTYLILLNEWFYSTKILLNERFYITFVQWVNERQFWTRILRTNKIYFLQNDKKMRKWVVHEDELTN